MGVITTQGDLLKQYDVDAIVNTVNCVGVMGKGIALQFKKKWPENFKAYANACESGIVKPGKMFIYHAGALATPKYIVNFPTKNHWKGSSHVEYIQDGLKDLIEQIKILNIRSIAIPPLGCGNGGLDWQLVKPLIINAFFTIPDVEVSLFEPVATPIANDMVINTKRPRMTPGRAAILKVLDTYRELNYGLSKIEVQKLAYFLQEAGENLSLQFVKHEYGPYAHNLNHVLNRMDGHFIYGVGDGDVESEIAPDKNALEEAERSIKSMEHHDLHAHVSRVARLIEGFQSPYGMELLATVHWVATCEQADTIEKAIQAVKAWNERKSRLMKMEHIKIAWDRLTAQSWI
jgi:O-acetyl-ADP-ribose deacetylase (regulator of RNase III)